MKKWIINQLECLPKDGELKNFVVVCHWSRFANITIDNKEYQSSVYGSQSFSKDNISKFIPYADLTYDIVCSWLDNSLDVNDLDINLDSKIDNQINPPIVLLPLPFQNPINSLNI